MPSKTGWGGGPVQYRTSIHKEKAIGVSRESHRNRGANNTDRGGGEAGTVEGGGIEVSNGNHMSRGPMKTNPRV